MHLEHVIDIPAVASLCERLGLDARVVVGESPAAAGVSLPRLPVSGGVAEAGVEREVAAVRGPVRRRRRGPRGGSRRGFSAARRSGDATWGVGLALRWPVGVARAWVAALLAALVFVAVLLLMPARVAAQEGDALDGDAVREVVSSARGGIAACYTEALARDPALGGRLELGFRVAASGAVERAEVVPGSTLSGRDEVFERCVLHVLRGLSFPAPGDAAVEVRFPLDFAPAQVAVPAARLTAESVALAALRERLRSDEEVLRCARQAASGEERLAGERLVVEFTVDAQGRITALRAVESTLDDSRLEACVLSAMSRVTLPAVAGQTAGTQLRVPFEFLAGPGR